MTNKISAATPLSARFIDLEDLHAAASNAAMRKGRKLAGEPAYTVEVTTVSGLDVPMLAATWETEDAA